MKLTHKLEDRHRESIKINIRSNPITGISLAKKSIKLIQQNKNNVYIATDQSQIRELYRNLLEEDLEMIHKIEDFINIYKHSSWP
ncbi:MAG: hypothetical protein K0S74_159 [Chlamydiales bacterium]|nr:hypothetical protein [Chlamydiales bacterium]